MQFSLSTWNYLKSLGDAADFERGLAEIAELGFGAELWLNWTNDPDLFKPKNRARIKGLCAGLPSLSAHSGVTKEFSLSRLLDEMDICSDLGADPLVCHPQTFGLDVHTWDYESNKVLSDDETALVDRIVSEAADRSLRLALENGPADILERVLAATVDHAGRRYLGICIDTGHAQMHLDQSKTPIVDMIERVGEDLIHLHFSDNGGVADDHAVPGHGTVDWAAVLDALQRTGRSAEVVFELNSPDPADAARRARETVLQYLPESR